MSVLALSSVAVLFELLLDGVLGQVCDVLTAAARRQRHLLLSDRRSILRARWIVRRRLDDFRGLGRSRLHHVLRRLNTTFASVIPACAPASIDMLALSRAAHAWRLVQRTLHRKLLVVVAARVVVVRASTGSIDVGLGVLTRHLGRRVGRRVGCGVIARLHSATCTCKGNRKLEKAN